MQNRIPKRHSSRLYLLIGFSVLIALVMLGACIRTPTLDDSTPGNIGSPQNTSTIQPGPIPTAATPALITPTTQLMVEPNVTTTSACSLSPIMVPTMPAEIPAYTTLDPATGLHVTGRVSEIDLGSYRLEVTGKVDHPLSLGYDDLRCMPKIEKEATLVCPGFFVDVATWAGASLEHILQLAGVQSNATQLLLFAADGYSTSVSLEEAAFEGNFLAYEWEGQPLPRLHGFPVRAIFPEMQGNSWVKFLVKIEVR
jgi:DMSO/TMAO reductase YedYZ molybdopterin-dependent catalytic subunit